MCACEPCEEGCFVDAAEEEGEEVEVILGRVLLFFYSSEDWVG